MDNEKDNVVVGEVISSSEERQNYNQDKFQRDLYGQMKVRTIKPWQIYLALAIIIAIFGLFIYLFIKYIEVFIILIIVGMILNFLKGIVK